MARRTRIVTGDWTADAAGKAVGYEAEIDANGWNGWVIPYFTPAVAARVVADQQARVQGFDDEFDLRWDGSEIVLTYPDYGDGHRDFERIAPDATGRYCIGGWLWTWEEVDDVEDVCREVVRG